MHLKLLLCAVAVCLLANEATGWWSGGGSSSRGSSFSGGRPSTSRTFSGGSSSLFRRSPSSFTRGSSSLFRRSPSSFTRGSSSLFRRSPSSFTRRSSSLFRKSPSSFTRGSSSLFRKSPSSFTRGSGSLFRRNPSSFTRRSSSLFRRSPSSFTRRTGSWGSSSGSSSGSSKGTFRHDIKTKSGLTNLYNSKVTKVERVMRPMVGVPFIQHSGVKVTTANGKQYLIHKGDGYGKSSQTVVVDAKHMSNKWKTTETHAVKDAKIADYVKNGGKHYNLILNNCHHASRRMCDIKG